MSPLRAAEHDGIAGETAGEPRTAEMTASRKCPAARSGFPPRRSADREGRDAFLAAPAPHELPDPNYADDLAYTDSWEHRL
jgi:hypothetical protein